jgi:Skp family chaperone for outer membrane proteins
MARSSSFFRRIFARRGVARPVGVAMALLLAFSAPAVAQRAMPATTRIGVIDSRELLAQMPGRAQVESAFAMEMARARELLRSATDAMKAAVDDFSQAESSLRPAQRESAMMVIRAREIALEDMVSQLNLLAGKRLEELQRPMLEEIQAAVKAVRERERIAMVFDLAVSNAVVDADKALNLNSRVLEEIRRRAATSQD